MSNTLIVSLVIVGSFWIGCCLGLIYANKLREDFEHEEKIRSLREKKDN